MIGSDFPRTTAGLLPRRALIGSKEPLTKLTRIAKVNMKLR